MSASEVLGIILITLVLVIQLAAAVYALLLIRLTGRNRAWLLMAMALGASAVAMAVVFVDEVLIDHEPDLALPAQLGGLLIATLSLSAVLAIRPLFVEMQQSQSDLGRTARLLRVLSDSNQALLRAADEIDLMESVCSSTVAVGDYRLAWVGLAQDDEERSVLPVAHAGSAHRYLEGLQVSWGEGPLGAGPTGTAIRTGETVYVRHIPTNPDFAPWREMAAANGLAALLALPLRNEERVFGSLNIYAEDPAAFGLEERELLEELANDLAYGLDHLRLRRRHREAKAAERRNEERVRALFEHADEAAFIVDERAAITFASPQAVPLFGFSPAELIGRNAFAIAHPEDLAEARRAFAALLEEPRGVTQFEGRVRRKDGSYGVMEMTWSNLLDEPLLQGVVINCRDVTEKRRTEAALKESEDRLRLSQRLEAVGQLAGGIAHDFNNLLTAICGYTDFLTSDLAASDPKRLDAAEIHRACDRAAGLIRQLLAFSRKQVLTPRVLDLNHTVSELEPLLRRLIGEDIALHPVLAPDLHPVLADSGQLEQVVMNLVVNARDAMPSGGRIVIETRNVEFDDDDVQRTPATRRGAHVLLTVSDTGVGMDAETQARIFEPFFTTKEPGRGTGLGLSTVYGIVKQSGGSVWVHSEPHHGTVFEIYLPALVAGVVEAQAEEKSVKETILSGTETVLLVEDDSMIRRLASRVLRGHGYEVLEADSGIGGQTIVAEHPDVIGCIVTDVVMPGMGGPDLALAAEQLRPGIKVLYITGYSPGTGAEGTFPPPGAWLLEKPFAPAELLMKVREVLSA